jgi:hypothetical protein
MLVMYVLLNRGLWVNAFTEEEFVVVCWTAYR